MCYVDGFFEVLKFGYEEKLCLVYWLDKDIFGVLLLVCIWQVVQVLMILICYYVICKIYWVVVVGVLMLYFGEIKYGFVKVYGYGKCGEGEKMYVVYLCDVSFMSGVKCVLM